MLRTCLISLAAMACMTGPASAQAVTRYVSGTFTAPATGSFSGSYVIDPATDTVVSVNIQTTAGTSQQGVPVPAGNFTSVGSQGSTTLYFATSVPATGQRGGFLSTFPQPKATASTADLSDGQCFNSACSGVNAPFRQGTATLSNTPPPAPPAPVPTLSEWAMILFGTVLAGGAALYVQRRRLIA